ncbi:MAG: PHP domain-containing protein [Spirochaetales bacterium]|nr:PHP domain-containing protein [Spirochaetales bacterium]
MASFKSEKINLHTHTCFCDHATGTVTDYVRSAMEAGLEVLGFTEHAPVAGDPISCNMFVRDLPAYVKAVNEAKKDFPIHIFLAGECDFEPILANYYRDELLGRYAFDYLTCSVHLYFDHDARRMCFASQSKDFTRYLRDYVARYCCALESGLFLFGCHADLFRASYLPWNEDAKAASRDIIQCAAEKGVPLEINARGLERDKVQTPDGLRYRYSTDEFFAMAAENGVKIILSSDAHDPAKVNDTAKCREMSLRLGIGPCGCTIEDGRIRI